MKHFSKEELIKALKRIEKELESKNKMEYFSDIISFLNVNKEDIDNTELHNADNIIEDIFVVWYESGICEDFSTEIHLLIKVDEVLDILDISRIEFNSYIAKQEKLLPKKS